jgi:hypothetical protein
MRRTYLAVKREGGGVYVGVNLSATSRKLTRVKRWSGSILSGTNSSPAEQARIVQLLVGRVDVSPDGVDLR